MKKTFFFLLLAFFTQLTFGQESRTISGVVTDADDGSPLIGVSVGVQGTTTGTMTDIDGRFTLNVPQGKSLVFNYVGYRPQTVAVRSGAPVNVAMRIDARMLDEVVAVGYGTMRRSDLTGAVGSVSGKDLRAAPVPKIDQALQGRMAGVTVNSNSGQPGADATIRVRGVGTLGNSDPIYVVDGIITDNINFLSPSDIASLEVLKDASASAIYGARGANGVILITTKRGETGQSNITFESYYGVQNRWRKLDVMGRDEMAITRARFTNTLDELQEKGLNAWIESNLTTRSSEFSVFYPRVMSSTDPDGFDYTKVETDWQDAIFQKDATIQNYYLSVDGGTDKSNYLISANYFDQEGLLIGSYYTRLTLRVNSSFQVKKWLKVGENLSFSNSKQRSVQGNGNTALIASALSMGPWDPIKYPEGTYANWQPRDPVTKLPLTRADARDLSGLNSSPSLFRNVMHPYNQALHSQQYPSDHDWVGNVYAEITPIKGLLIRGDVGTRLYYGLRRSFSDALYVTNNALDYNGVSQSMTRSQYLAYTGTATYNTLIDKKHDLTAMVGVTVEESTGQSVSVGGSRLKKIESTYWYVDGAPNLIDFNDPDDISKGLYSTRTGGGSASRARSAAYIGRLHYQFDNKYLLTSNIRVDGSDKLTRGKYFEVFPSVAAAWKISEEDFFEPLLDKIDFLKLRLGWGKLGNERSLDEAGAIPQVGRNDTWMYAYPFGNPSILQSGMGITSYPPIILWESTEQYNIGLDFSLLRGLITGNLDLFQRYTHDMHMGIVNPGHVGFRYMVKGNAATVSNKGVELSLEHRNKVGSLTYNVGGNVSIIKNELTKLNAGEPLWEGILFSDEGLPLRTMYLYTYDGVFQTQEEVDGYTWTNPETGDVKKIQPDARPGDAKYLDINNDGQITIDDRSNQGNPFPWLTYGFNIGAEYKGFDLQMFFQGVAGNKVFNYLRLNKLESDSYESVLSTDMRNVFLAGPDPNDPTKIINIMPGSNGSIPNPTLSTTQQVQNKYESTRFLEDASYLRLKNIQLGYTIPKHITRSVAIERARIYIAASNLLTFTKYKGFDPEVGTSGRDYGNYPQVRTVMVGVNVNF